MTTNLSNLLKGCRLIRDAEGHVVVQSIRNMELVFLTTDAEFSLDDRFENPIKAIMSNQSYGHLRMENPTDKDIVVAPQVAVMTKYAAQNHAMTKSAYIRAHSTQDYNDAGCVQGSQSGTIHAGKENDLRFVPVSIREMLLDATNKTGEGFSRIYSAVDKLGQKTGVRTGSYLDLYFTKYDASNMEFIAHFERPENCIGVVVMIDGEIVAIDKFPSFTYCAQVWDLLIRDCYGSLAIEGMNAGKVHTDDFAVTFATVDKHEGQTTADFLGEVLSIMRGKRSDRVIERLQEVMDVLFEEELDKNTKPGFVSDILKAEGYIGQVIKSGDYVHLVSLCKRDRFDPSRLRETMRVTNEYRIMAEKQREFTL